MESSIPSSEEVRAELLALSYGQVQRLSALSSVPFTTLWNMRGKDAANPRIDTVHRFWPHLSAAREGAPSIPAEQEAV